MNRKAFLIILLLFILGALTWFLVIRLESHGPTIIQNQEIKFLNKQRILDFRLEDRESGIRNITIVMVQDSLQREVYMQEFSGNPLWGKGDIHYKDVHVDLDPVKMKLREGTVDLLVKAHDFSWRNKFKGNITLLKKSFVIDWTPPTLSCLSTQHYINQGGSGLVVYRTSDDSIKNGVQVGDLFFPGFPAHTSTTPDVYIAYFAVPYDLTEPRVELTSEDEAGNESRTGFYYLIRGKNFRCDSIHISDTFLQRKIPHFFTLDETLRGTDLIESFLKINNQMRQENNQRIREICQQSLPERQWKGKFLRLRNAKTSALFADERTYYYKGKKVDKQIHLGIDLASTAHAPVPAANTGVIIFQGDIGIYGRTIIIDHGQNIFSMYCHLSDYNVTQGQKINKGDIVGITGDTGLAGGDHLHFAILIGSVFVNPIEWWDPHWIEDNILLKLKLTT